MNDTELREAIETLKDPNSSERPIAFKTLITLAEKFLSVGKDLPAKRNREECKCFIQTINRIRTFIRCGCAIKEYNLAIDDCQLSIAKNYWHKISKDELEVILFNHRATNLLNKEARDNVAQAIIDKLEGGTIQ